MRIILIDADMLVRAQLHGIIEQLDADQGMFAVVAEAGSADEALALSEQHQPDVVIMSAALPDRDGLAAAAALAHQALPPAVILYADTDCRAREAFAVDAIDFLLKPLEQASVEHALRRASRLNRAQLMRLARRPQPQFGPRSHISARIRRGTQLVPVDEVRYFQADHKYVTVRWPGGELLIDESLRRLEAEFHDRFVRIHRNALVAVQHLESLERDGRGHYYVRLRGIDDQLDVSRRHVAGLRRFLQSF